jgi:polyhydroxyalkanoate synthesis regulator phasin
MKVGAMVSVGEDASRIAQNEGLRRYLDAGLTFTHVNRARAAELVQELIKSGELERDRAEEWIEDLVRRTRERSEELIRLVRNEIRSQLDDLGLTNLDHVAKQIADILTSAPENVRKAAVRRGPVTKRRAARKAGVKKATTKTSATNKRAPVKKAPAKRVSATKAPIKKAATKKAPVKKASAS